MSGISELLRSESDGSLSFGNYELKEKAKLSDFGHEGDVYKVKTHEELTRLEKNDAFLYESVPGTTVRNLIQKEDSISFTVEGFEDAQLTLELEESTEYEVFVDEASIGVLKTNMSGKLSFGVELEKDKEVKVLIRKA